MYPPRKSFPANLDRGSIELLLLAYMAEYQVEPVVWQNGFIPFIGDCIEEYLDGYRDEYTGNEEDNAGFPMITARGDTPYYRCIPSYGCCSRACVELPHPDRNHKVHPPLSFLPWPDPSVTESTT
jgi:hypothetical protein